jgi:glucose/arabinose dehydrogenase
MTVPGVQTDAGEGGLLGLAVSPDFERDGLVYAYLTSARDNRIVRMELEGGGEPEVVFDGIQARRSTTAGGIAFGPDGMLYAGTGDAGDTSLAQDPSSPNGKILRLEPDGSVPDDNPRDGSPVLSLGHRNVQGLAWDDRTACGPRSSARTPSTRSTRSGPGATTAGPRWRATARAAGASWRPR